MEAAVSKHQPLRWCRICRRQLPKSDLQRWTVQEGELRVDIEQTAPGRGYYSCSPKCADIMPRTLNRKKKA